MYIYNVTIKVTHAIADEWIAWMQQEHLAEVVGTGLFDQYAFFELLEPLLEEEEGRTFVAQYTTDSLVRYEAYITDFAPLLRDKGFARFGNQFIAFRSLMKKMMS